MGGAGGHHLLLHSGRFPSSRCRWRVPAPQVHGIGAAPRRPLTRPTPARRFRGRKSHAEVRELSKAGGGLAGATDEAGNSSSLHPRFFPTSSGEVTQRQGECRRRGGGITRRRGRSTYRPEHCLCVTKAAGEACVGPNGHWDGNFPEKSVIRYQYLRTHYFSRKRRTIAALPFYCEFTSRSRVDLDGSGIAVRMMPAVPAAGGGVYTPRAMA